MRIAIVFLGLVLLFSTAAHSRTWQMPADAPTIQAGIDIDSG